MKPNSAYKEYNWGVIRDAFVIILLFTAFYFIDVGVAVFLAIITAVILLTRRIILTHNPGFIKGHHIYYEGKELTVPKGVDVFDLSNSASIDYLYTYIEIIRGILVPPKVLIIRLSGIIHLEESELETLSEAVRRLQKSKIIVIFSEADENILNQFRRYNTERNIGMGNIFYGIDDALKQANKVLKDRKAI